MALIYMTVPSKALRRETEVSVLLPDVREREPEKEIYEFEGKFPVLYLFHGAGGGCRDWIRYTGVERLANRYGTAVVMPCAGLSFYTDMHSGEKYFSYIADELPAYMRKVFPLSERREDNCAAGLSMGGYGAVKLALTFPERYRAAASMSGVLDAAALMRDTGLTGQIELDRVLEWCYGSPSGAARPENSLELLMERALAGGKAPALYQCVGTGDFLYEVNQRFRKKAREAGLPLTYREGPGAHDWDYWEARLPEVFAWLYGAGQTEGGRSREGGRRG